LQLSELITVAPRYTRAINLERDAATPGAIDGYTVTITAREFLGRLAQSLTAPTGHRAWTLTGPYGSGKSAFALYLANLF
jgi:polynucleotide 5'-kinase involved in rRNA processing